MNKQTNIVLSYLETGKRISSRNAVIEFGIQDLPKRISELRQQGYKIESERVDGVSRYGTKTHWCEYWLTA